MADRTKRDALSVVAAMAAAAAIAAMAWQASTAEQIHRAEHCGYDGRYYCAMAMGHRGILPYNRRILTPAIVRLLHFGPVTARFLMLDAVALFASAALTFALVRRLALRRRSTAGRAASAGVVAASLVLLAPSTWHLAFSYPALTDETALALGLAWIALVDSRHWSSIAFAAAVTLCREAWGPPIMIGMAVAVVLCPRNRRLWFGNIAASVLALGVGFTQPVSGIGFSGPSGLPLVGHMLRVHFSSPHGVAIAVWMTVSGLGFVCGLLPRFGATAYPDRITRVIAGVALGHFLLAYIGGSDLDRLLLTAGVLATILVMSTLAKMTPSSTDLGVGVLWLATVLVWRPWTVVPGDDAGFVKTFALHAVPWVEAERRMVTDAVMVVVLALLTGLLMHYGRPARQRENTSPGRV